MTEAQEPMVAAHPEPAPEPAAISTDSTADASPAAIAPAPVAAAPVVAADTNAPVTTTAATVPTAPTPTATTTTATAPGIVDREKLCPFLLKMFYKQGEHNRVDSYSPKATPPKSSELQLYTWKNATIGEIASLVKQAIPDLIDDRLPGAGGELRFRHIFLDLKRGIFIGRDIGSVLIADTLAEETEVVSAEDVEMKADGENGAGSETAEIDPAQGLFTSDIRKNKDTASAAATASTAAGAAAAANRPPSRRSTALEKTLGSIRFVIGDYLDIAIISQADVSGRGASAVGAGGAGGRRDQALFTGRHGRGGGGGGGGGGPMRHGRNDGRRRGGGGGGGGGGGRRGNDMVDRFAGRLGLVESLDRNGHGNHGISRKGTADMEGSWKGRGRGR
ncbi:Histone deacetylase complex subunit sap18 [Linnemannia exigua]|uniref:Histone deacetylase complex subunit sap18 n=1 Tax=Linnemannia exigua TaxID=604196 RepID=A0AAD4D4R0_9FUNG|nr:Histone deacetylase complex subunit sap18 [Linnemannia exigua]